MPDKKYCNQCGFETKWDDNGCVWHQMTLQTDDGETYQRFDEFDQNGEAY